MAEQKTRASERRRMEREKARRAERRGSTRRRLLIGGAYLAAAAVLAGGVVLGVDQWNQAKTAEHEAQQRIEACKIEGHYYRAQQPERSFIGLGCEMAEERR